jgi:MOSC domain-containing protein YiiM
MPMFEGRVSGLQRSSGGVPKLPVERAVVRQGGMEGDRQANRKYHGGPQRALCLYSQERLDALAAAGHPVARGHLGENVTISGLPWERVRPGARLQLGAVETEVTGFAAPCKKIAYSFSDGDFVRVGEKVNPGWSRVYVRVVVEGEVAVGDRVALTI